MRNLATDSFPFAPAYTLGADITWTLEDEAAGATYSDGGKLQPLEQIMVSYGFNYVRMRTFVNPSATGGYSPGKGFADIAHTVIWAKRVKACGLGILLDFHMSDTWASIGVQTVPGAWAGLSPSAMQQAAHGMGRGSFIWEPTRCPQMNGGATGSNSVLFDNTGGNGGHDTSNAAIAHYATLAKSYGLPVPSGTCRTN